MEDGRDARPPLTHSWKSRISFYCSVIRNSRSCKPASNLTLTLLQDQLSNQPVVIHQVQFSGGVLAERREGETGVEQIAARPSIRWTFGQAPYLAGKIGIDVLVR